MEPSSIPAIFWPSEDPSVIAPGRVTLEAGSPPVVRLEGDASAVGTIQTVIENCGVVRGTITDHESVVHGPLGKPAAEVTIYGPIGMATRVPSEGPQIVEFEAGFVLIGHGPESAEPEFSGIVVEFDRLRVLMQKSLQVKNSQNPDSGEIESLVHRSPQSVRASCEQFTLTLDHGFSIRSVPGERHTAEFQAAPRVVAESETTKPFGLWVSEVVTPMRDLITLVSGDATIPTAIQLIHRNDVSPGFVTPLTAIVRQGTVPWRGQHRDELFKLDDAPIPSPDFITKWFEVRRRFGPALDLLYMSTDRDIRSAEIRFLLTIQALESFHRRSGFGQARWSGPDHEAIIAAIENAHGLSDEQQQWIQPRIQHNEVSLTRRIKDVMKPVQAAFTQMFGSDFSAFVQKVIQSRNILTHRLTPPLPEAIIDSQGLNIMEALVRMSVEAHLLKEAGIPIDRAAVLISETRRYKEQLLSLHTYARRPGRS